MLSPLENHLLSLQKPEPEARFVHHARTRLMEHIHLYEQETWFQRLLKKAGPVVFPAGLFQSVRVRLMARVAEVRQPVFRWFLWTKRLVATTLALTIAVTAVLFSWGNQQPVSAAENTWLEVTAGRVTLKHSPQLIRDTITTQTELSAGDLIQVEEDSSAVIHFFDDTQLRLSENSLLLLSRLDISPGYARQGIIEASLHQGRAWAQTINAEDGHARFTLVTPSAIVSSVNAVFDVQAPLFEPTSIRVFGRQAQVKALQTETRRVLAEGEVSSLQKIILGSDASLKNVQSRELSAFAPILDLSAEDRDEEWARQNLEADSRHLAQLQERELKQLKASTGSLPGDAFYFLKRARERLGLALSLNDNSQTQTQINIAKQRLNEAIVLFSEGQNLNAQEALAEYQELARQMALNVKEKQENPAELSRQILTPPQKTLLAALPSDARITPVKAALDATEALLVTDPQQTAELRLQNAVDELIRAQVYLTAGDMASAQEALKSFTLPVSHELAASDVSLNEEQKKALYERILEVQHEQKRLLTEIERLLTEQAAEPDLLAMVHSTGQRLGEEIKTTAVIARPVLPDVNLKPAVLLPMDEKVHEFTQKVNLYSTWQGQKNQISRLLAKYPQYAQDPVFLGKLRDRLDGRSKELINQRILEIDKAAKLAKAKEVQRKLDRGRKKYEIRSKE